MSNDSFLFDQSLNFVVSKKFSVLLLPVVCLFSEERGYL